MLITREHDHHRTLTAIECKDHGRPVGVGIIEGFAPKARGCGVHRAIIVSRTGFTQPARRKAAELAIDCMTLSAAPPEEVRVTFDLRHRHVTFLFAHYSIQGPGRVAQPYVAFRSSGEAVTDAFLAELAGRYAPQPDAIELATGARDYRIELKGSGGLYLIDARGERFEPTEVLLDVTCTFSAEPTPMEDYVYEGAGKRYVISISAPLVAGANTGRSVFVDDEAGLRGAFVAESP